EIAQLHGHYRPWEWIAADPLLAEVFALIERGHFSQGDMDRFRPLSDQLRGSDPFFVLADFASYLQAQARVSATWADRRRWHQMALLNTARSGFFSSDRAIGAYAERIWDVTPSPVALGAAPMPTDP
ncbi:glycogen/starch/alpha-glucan phosphorylase, partial [Cyanobium gracile UHCC 0139]